MGKGSGLPVCVACVDKTTGKYAYTKLYKTKAWRELRRKVLAAHPLCVYCLSINILTPANTVDHVQAHRGDTTLFNDINNLQSLCATCHNSQAQIKDNSGHAPTPYGVDGLPLDGYSHHWSKGKPQG